MLWVPRKIPAHTSKISWSQMPNTHDGLSEQAKRLFDRLDTRISSVLEEVNRTPVSVLIWGPNPTSDSPTARVRTALRSDLRAHGHAAFFSEELCDPAKGVSVRVQQIAQAQAFDLVVSIPSSPGAIGEVHDFVADRRVHSKLLVFVNKAFINGYSAQSLEAVSTVLSCELHYYEEAGLPSEIADRVSLEVKKIRELKFILAGRL